MSNMYCSTNSMDVCYFPLQDCAETWWCRQQRNHEETCRRQENVQTRERGEVLLLWTHHCSFVLLYIAIHISSMSRRLQNLILCGHKLFQFCRILWKKNEVADYEATTFSIFYNNALFLALVIIASFYLLRSFSPPMYPFTSTFKKTKESINIMI